MELPGKLKQGSSQGQGGSQERRSLRSDTKKRKQQDTPAENTPAEANQAKKRKIATGEKEFLRHRKGSGIPIETTPVQGSRKRKKGKEVDRGENHDIDDEKSRKRRKKVIDPVPLDRKVRENLKATLDNIMENSNKINEIRYQLNVNAKLKKPDRKEISEAIDEAATLSGSIARKLASNDPVVISQADIDRLETYHKRRITEWATYLRERYVEDNEDAERPKSTGTKEWYRANRHLRPKDRKVMAAYAECLGKIARGESLKPDDIYSEFGSTPYKLFKPGERDDITDVKFPGTDERVRVIQLNKGDTGITIVFPRVGLNGNVKEIFKKPYRAAGYVGHGNGYAPSVDTMRSLGYTWGPLVFGNSHTVAEANTALYKFFQENNDPNNPADLGRWIMYNGSVTAPTFVNYASQSSDIKPNDILKALRKNIPDKPVKNGNDGAGAGDGNESFGFPSGTGSCSFEIQLPNKEGELETHTCALLVHSNFARLRFLDIAGVHLEDGYSEAQKKGVHRVDESQGENGTENESSEKGSVNSLFLTTIGLSAHTLQELAKFMTACYTKYGYNAHFSHDVAYAVSLANTDCLPPNPNYNPDFGKMQGSAFREPKELAVEWQDLIKELLKNGIEKALFSSLLASQDMEKNGFKGNRMPPKETVGRFYGTGRFKPDLGSEEIDEGVYTDYHSELESSDSEAE